MTDNKNSKAGRNSKKKEAILFCRVIRIEEA